MASANELEREMTLTDHEKLAQLREVLNIDAHRAEILFAEAGCDFDAAVALYFAQQQNEPGPSMPSRGTPRRENQLQRTILELGLPAITLQQSKLLLKKTRDSVERSVELYVADPGEAGPTGPPQRRETINLAASSSEDEAEAAQEALVEAPSALTRSPTPGPSINEEEEEEDDDNEEEENAEVETGNVESGSASEDDLESEMEMDDVDDEPAVVAVAAGQEDGFWKKAGEEYDAKFKIQGTNYLILGCNQMELIKKIILDSYIYL